MLTQEQAEKDMKREVEALRRYQKPYSELCKARRYVIDCFIQSQEGKDVH